MCLLTYCTNVHRNGELEHAVQLVVFLFARAKQILSRKEKCNQLSRSLYQAMLTDQVQTDTIYLFQELVLITKVY